MVDDEVSVPATVDGAALRCLVVCAHGAGLDVAGVLPADAEAQELPLPQVIALVTALLQRGEPGWALRGASRVPLGAMGVLDHLCQAAPTVRACLTDFARYFALVAYRGHAALEGDALVIAFDVDVPALERMFVEATVGLVWSRLRDYLGRPEASPARVELRGPVDPRTRPGWERAVGGELLGDRPANR
ncbi:MAG: AraC family transcriptional regulator ligand-binding domain-containing protein, partial [Myxococcales bacterium]|nr:AraC family transcriptional regulator ligand-binding domain-containing protein [Myxococcales bacterium]